MHVNSCLVVTVCALASLVFPSTVSAELIHLRFTGTIDSATAPDPYITTLFPVGSLADVILSYDSSVQENNSVGNWRPGDPTFGFYWDQSVDVTASIAGHSYSAGNIPQFLYVLTDPAALWFDGSMSETLSGDRVGDGPVWQAHYLDFTARWPGATFASDSLPTLVPDSELLGSFTLGLLTCRFGSECATLGITRQDARIRGTFTSVRAIPEPSAVALVLLGLAGAAVTRGRTQPTRRRPAR